MRARGGRRPDDAIDVLVAGVPYGMPRPFADGRWLTSEHVALIEAISPRIRLVHVGRAELERGELPEDPPEVILTETTGSVREWGETEWLRYLARGDDLRNVITPRLRWLQSCSHGVEHLLPLVGDSVVVTRGVDIHSIGLAETVMAAILFHCKRLRDRLDHQYEHRWELLEYAELHGATLLVLGTGSVGSAVARLAAAFGMRVVGVRRTAAPAAHFAEVTTPEHLPRVLPRSQYVVVACPLTTETRGLLGARELAMLPRGAFVANVARGEIVDEAALRRALEMGHLGGAFLDVFVREPLPSDDPLWDAPNLLIVPHDSHSTQLVADRNVAYFAANLRRYVAGEELVGVVDRTRGY